MSQYDWIRILLHDMDSFARMNCLPKTAEAFRKTLLVTEAELKTLGIPVERSTAGAYWSQPTKIE